MRAETHQQRRQQDESTRVLYDLCSMIIHILRSPPLPLSSPAPSSRSPRQASPAAFASLFFGISVAMMLFGSLTFVIGFFLMPMVIGLLMLFYLIAFIYNLSELGRAILWPGCPPSPNSAAVPPGWTYL